LCIICLTYAVVSLPSHGETVSIPKIIQMVAHEYQSAGDW
jgi:hypothetical protein